MGILSADIPVAIVPCTGGDDGCKTVISVLVGLNNFLAVTGVIPAVTGVLTEPAVIVEADDGVEFE